jgi:hypothetical protein
MRRIRQPLPPIAPSDNGPFYEVQISRVDVGDETFPFRGRHAYNDAYAKFQELKNTESGYGFLALTRMDGDECVFVEQADCGS